MTNFDDTVTAKGLIVSQGVHAGPSGPGEPGAIAGSVHVYDQAGTMKISLDADNSGQATVEDSIFTGAIHVGLGKKAASVNIYDDSGKNVVVSITGTGGGDIVLANGDVAEEFDVDPATETLTPGSVVVVSGTDAVSNRFTACDPRVIGVVAGAGRYRPALVLDHRAQSKTARVAVSLVGKAECRVVAYAEPVNPGDFLVAGLTAGCAMKAPEHAVPRGAILGRALGHLAPRTSGMMPALLSPR